jgi:hypothetical protein
MFESHCGYMCLTIAGEVDALYVFLVLLSLFMTTAIFTMILIFAIRYRRRPGVQAARLKARTSRRSPGASCHGRVHDFFWSAIIFFKQRASGWCRHGLRCGETVDAGSRHEARRWTHQLIPVGTSS